MPTAAFKAAVFAQETEEVFAVLLTIDHDALTAPIRASSSGEDIVSNGNTFIAYPFEVRLSEDNPDSPPTMHLTIDNVDQTIVRTIRSIVIPPSVTMQVVRASAPDVIEVSFEDFRMNAASGNALTVSGELSLEFFLSEPYPYQTFGPARFPGCF